MRKAFTLIELLVVISIIGILIGLSIFGLQGARLSSRDAKRKADLEQIRSGLEIYKSDCNGYPLSIAFGSPLTGNDSLNLMTCPSTNTYINQVPVDPVSSTQNYTYTSDGVTYDLCASLEQSPNPTPDPNGPVASCGSCGGNGCNYVVTNP